MGLSAAEEQLEKKAQSWEPRRWFWGERGGVIYPKAHGLIQNPTGARKAEAEASGTLNSSWMGLLLRAGGWDTTVDRAQGLPGSVHGLLWSDVITGQSQHGVSTPQWKEGAAWWS